MILTYRGSVNRWECDENDHMNVRFYMQRHFQALMGHPHPPEGDIEVQHIRFHRESRLAEPLSGYAGIVRSDGQTTDYLTELKSERLRETVSTCIHKVTSPGHETDTRLPEHAQPRGVADNEAPWFGMAPAELEEFGFNTVGMGRLLDAELNERGELAKYHYMGRLSDSMPHLWRLLERDSDDGKGGAVLEYRLGFHRSLQRNDRFRILSGISQAEGKLQHFVHFMFDQEDRLCMTAQAVGVRLDLDTRRAMKLDEKELARLDGVLLKDVNGMT